MSEQREREEADEALLHAAAQLSRFLEESLGLEVVTPGAPGVKFPPRSQVVDLLDRIWEYGGHQGKRPSELRRTLQEGLDRVGKAEPPEPLM